MTKRMVIMLILVGVLFGGVFGFEAFRAHMIKKFLTSRGIPAQTVSTIKAAETKWQPQMKAVGTLKAVHGVNISPEVSGTVTGIHFHSGEEVKAGAPVLNLDASSDIAKLHSLEANSAHAEQTFRRDQQQFQEKAISQATLDTATANLKSTRAQVEEQKALIAKKAIRAPFAGRLGIRQVNLGQYLNPGAVIVTLQDLDPIYVDFFLPQKSIHQIHVGDEVSVKADAFPVKTFSGTISAISPQVDLSTRNVEVRAAVHNPRHQLLPGMFATVDIRVGASRRYVTLPQTAITFNPYGNTVFLVKKNAKRAKGKTVLVAEQKFVTTGSTRGDQIAILKGVKPGDTVVTSGQMKLRNGIPVVINNAIHPTDNPAPQPKDE